MRPAADIPTPPAHGYRGDPEPVLPARPRGLSVAISREAGARGGSIARKVGELLGWQVFDQESIDYLIQNDTAREQMLAEVPAAALAWTQAHFNRLQDEQKLVTDPDTAAMIRLLFAVAARGEAIILGRGAGYLLPAETTLHVRVVAPWEDRVVYFAQLLRLSRDEGAAEVQARDERRSHYIDRILGRNAAEVTAYDVVVNSGRLGVEGAAQFISWAVRTKQAFLDLQASEAESPDFPKPR